MRVRFWCEIARECGFWLQTFQVRSPLPPPRGDWAMRMRFWGESTRDQEKLVRLSSRNFLGRSTVCPTRISPQSPITLPNHRALLFFSRGLGALGAQQPTVKAPFQTDVGETQKRVGRIHPVSLCGVKSKLDGTWHALRSCLRLLNVHVERNARTLIDHRDTSQRCSQLLE